MFELVTDYEPHGDQPAAIEALTRGVLNGLRHQMLLGVTGSGKTFTMANVIARVQRPVLVISHNKTLAAQLCSEFRAFFPHNAVEYFVSYYDYYQPEAYIPQTDTYIEKDSSINDEIDRLKHRAVQAVLSRRDTIVVASVSCIFGLGSPADYRAISFHLQKGDKVDRDGILRRLVDMRYERSEDLSRGKFRVRGDRIEICLPDAKQVVRIGLADDVIERIDSIDPVTGNLMEQMDYAYFFPATHFATPSDKMERAINSIESELAERLKRLKGQGKLLEAERLGQRTQFDLEMMREVGYCSGMENYSIHFDNRKRGEPPYTLLDYFPPDVLTIIDESHMTLPQLAGMYAGDRARKESLIRYGFRLPSARDHRPLRFGEFEGKIGQVVYTSATPGPYEREHSTQIVEQVIRPTGLVDPKIVLKPAKGEVDDLIGEIRAEVARGERTLVTTLTKRSAENLAEYLSGMGIKVHYLHSEIDTLKRPQILRDLRLGEYDVVVGINLLREGLDLPEVSLVAILDADREGFLRSETSLIQTIGRASRNVFGRVIMYADHVTESMKRAISETNRRRCLQLSYNVKHGIVPRSVRKEVRDLIAMPTPGAEVTTAYTVKKGWGRYAKDKVDIIIANLEEEMLLAAKNLEFERAARIRDQIARIRGRALEGTG